MRNSAPGATQRHDAGGPPRVENILDFIHPGETLVVTRIDRLARSMQDLQVIVARLKERGAHLAATEKPVDTSTAAGKAFFDMLGVFAEFETNLRQERQAEGIKAATRKGVYRGRPPKIDIVAIQARLDAGISPTEVTREMGGRAEPSIKQRPKWLLAAMSPKGTIMKKKSLKQKSPMPKPPVQAKAKVSSLRNLTPELYDRLQWDLMEACLAVTETHGLTVERAISQI